MNINKIMVLIISLVLSINLVACGSNPEENTNNESELLESGTNTENDEDSIEVDEGLFTVDVTLPASFFEESTEEEIISNAEEEGYISAKVNDNGSVTYTMTRIKRNEKLKDMKDVIDESIMDLLEGSDEVESFVDIEYNDNLSKVDIYVDPESYSDWDSIYAIQFYLLGSFYQIFDGVEPESIDVLVDFINANNGDFIESGSYSSWSENNGISNNGGDIKSEPEPEVSKILKLNEAVTVGNLMEITLTDYEWVESILPSNTSEGYSYYQDEEGEKYFVIRGKLKNAGSKDLDVQWISESEVVLNETYKFNATMELESNDGSDFYGTAKPLQTLNLIVYASISDEAYEIWESVDVTIRILSDGEYIDNFFDIEYPHDNFKISFTK